MRRDTLRAVLWGLVAGVVFALFTSGCGAPSAPLCEDPLPESSITVGIVDGELSEDRRSSVLVSMPTGWCSGTIVGPHTVLTAGHCNQDSYRVVVEGVDIFEVYDDKTHPDYIFPQSDLHLLYTVAVLPEPYATIGLPDGASCSVLLAQGYGIGSEGALHERVVIESSRQFGIIRTSPATCNGDSGGGLYGWTDQGWVLVGVTSFGTARPPDCDISLPGFVDLQEPINADWIEENTL